MSIRNKALFIHLSASGIVLAVLTAWVLTFWYAPWPLLSLQGGLKILGMLVAIDLILGPALTWLVFKPEKSRRMLIFDLSVIILVQVAAFSYGAWALYSQRPLYLAFVLDRFEVARAADLSLDLLDPDLMPDNYRGAHPVQVELPSSLKLEMMLSRTLKDRSMGLRTQYYRTFPGNQKTEQLAALAKKLPTSPNALHDWLASHKLAQEQVLLFPVLGQNKEGTAIISRDNGELIGLLDETW